MKVYRSTSEKIVYVFIIIFMVLYSITMIYPLLNAAAISFNTGANTTANPSIIFPKAFTLENYKTAFSYPAIGYSFIVSISRTILGTLYHMAIIIMAAFVMTKKNFILKNIVLVIFMIPMFLSPGMIPTYLNIKNLGLRDNFLVYIIPGGFSFYNFLIMRSYMAGIPAEIEESALMDGAGFWRTLMSIILPMSVPAIAALSLFTAVAHWNDFYTTMMYISNEKLYTLQFLLQRILKEVNLIQDIKNSQLYVTLGQQVDFKITTTPTSIRMAILMISTVPILVVYPFIQKHFAAGVTLGAVKG